MPRTIACKHCGVRLNLPEGAAGKRLKCPKCGEKFLAEAPDLNAASTAPGIADASLATTLSLPQMQSNPDLPTDSGVRAGTGTNPDLPKGSGVRPKGGTKSDLPMTGAELRARGHGDVDLPTASGDLRDTFDLPLLVDDNAPGQTADATSLFTEKPNATRRVGAAEARARARRCPTCGGVVPAGMAICSSCGLNLETGMRVELDDDLLPVAAPRAAGPPMGVSIVGGLCLLGSFVLAVVSFGQWLRNLDGFQYLALVCVFGIYASVQFLRGKSAKLLLVALTLGVLINIVALIALPIFDANNETTVIPRTATAGSDDEESVEIQSITDRLNTQKLSFGILGLVMYAGISVYLMSPTVRRHFSRRDMPH